MSWSRRTRHHLSSPLGIVTAVLLLVLLVTAILAPPLLGDRAEEIVVGSLQAGASADHPFGTDALGRDVFTRTLVATRMSLVLALLVVAIGVVAGLIIGAVPIVLGKRAGRVVVAGLNLLVAFPGLLLALFLAMIFGVGARGAVLSMAIAFAPSFARLTHTTASGIANADYVSAARLLGVSRWRILTRHVIPNISEPLVVNMTSQVGAALLSISALSYLGFGVQPPSYDWGRMLSDGLPAIYTNPAAALAPCIAIVVAGLTFVLAGELLTQILGGSHHGHLRIPSRLSRRPGPEAAAPARSADDGDDVLRLDGLTVTVPGETAPFSPVIDVSLRIRPGEIVGLVGESGSGKSLTAMAAARLISYPGLAEADVHQIKGQELRRMRPRERERLLGTSLAMVFQDPMSSLNPTLKVGRQLAEVAETHEGLTRRDAWQRAVDRLSAVLISSPEVRAKQYPMELSGGMRQRASIAMGLMAQPALIIADEPTTALDVTVQREVLNLLERISEQTAAAVLLISHDIAVVAETASRVLVMYAGRVVEELPVSGLVTEAAHPYTRALVASIPDMSTDRSQPLASIPGRPPHAADLPAGCAFAPRCGRADDRCLEDRPELVDSGRGGAVACWHPLLPAGRATRGVAGPDSVPANARPTTEGEV
ncbi:dipeptide/oligopeptide/nickel ABC transporter permease/ATP-binding protein [Jiangella alba]|uniref:Oligopeptide/dipeptide ABC transporter, ATP-binding protein, C-terminal domain-containing protein n=1 Tax=Jiangella alba TaxID=561176 RepID=A0A1H5L555_9ACTN|nr:dipeptide/oligopeptide/nickel ABC transporter permease/ATP-binding protein [Jiangella alba]SEE72202.1 oligopeptide/dipeptide ABC transporter, ATP-binding protein, C-terminal domain-containing protein [Jiangella alba]